MKRNYFPIFVCFVIFFGLLALLFAVVVISDNPNQSAVVSFCFWFILLTCLFGFAVYGIGKDDGAGPLTSIDYVKDGTVFQVTGQFPVHITSGDQARRAQGYLLRDLKDTKEKEYAFLIYTSECVGGEFFSPGVVIQKKNNKWVRCGLSQDQ